MSSEFRYNLTISGADSVSVEKAISDFKREGIAENLLQLDLMDKTNGKCVTAFFSTESISPYGTVSCWDTKEHETLLHSLSLKNPSVVFELSGEDIDDPNNSVFKKAFQNGLFKEAYLEKQDVDSVLKHASWREYGTPEREGKEAEIFHMFEVLSDLRSRPGYQIASDMAYIQTYIQLDDPLTDQEAYTLALKLSEASGGWFTAAVLHEEHLDALRHVLELGLHEDYCPDLPELSPDNARKLLLTADNQVFGTLIEVAAICSQIHYNEWEHHQEPEDLQAVVSAIEAIENAKPSLSDKIASAEGKASALKTEQGISISQPQQEIF